MVLDLDKWILKNTYFSSTRIRHNFLIILPPLCAVCVSMTLAVFDLVLPTSGYGTVRAKSQRTHIFPPSGVHTIILIILRESCTVRLFSCYWLSAEPSLIRRWLYDLQRALNQLLTVCRARKSKTGTDKSRNCWVGRTEQSSFALAHQGFEPWQLSDFTGGPSHCYSSAETKTTVNHLEVRPQELCESRGGRPGLPSLISLRFLWT